MASISVDQRTTSSFRLRLTGLDTSYSGAARYLQWYVGGVLYGDGIPVSNGAANSAYYYVTGLDADTHYVLEAVVSNGSQSWTFTNTTDGYTLSSGSGGGGGSSLNVTPWDWNAANSTAGGTAEATAAQTQAFYQGLYGNTTVENMSYKVWNDLVAKANEVVTGLGYSWTGRSLSLCKMTANRRQMTAAIYNAVVNNLMQISGVSGLSTVSAGDSVTGRHFWSLTTTINLIISTH